MPFECGGQRMGWLKWGPSDDGETWSKPCLAPSHPPSSLTPFLVVTLFSLCRSKVKTVHERIPLAGLSKLPSIPQIAKVKHKPWERWLSLAQGWPLGWGCRLDLRRLYPWGREGQFSLCPLTAGMTVYLPNTVPSSSWLPRLLGVFHGLYA